LVWSLGCVLFELMTLHFPYSGINPTDCENFIINGIRPMLQYHQNIIPKEYLNDSIWKNLVFIFENCTLLQPEKRLNINQILELLNNIHLENNNDEKEKKEEKLDRNELEFKMKSVQDSLIKATESADFDSAVEIGSQLKSLKLLAK